MWLVIFAVFAAAALAGIAYMSACAARFGLVKKLSRDKKFLKYLISFLLVAVELCLFAYFISLVNAVMIFLSEVMVFWLVGAAFKLLRHFTGKEFSDELKNWLSVALTAVYLVSGWYFCHSVVQKDYKLTTDKDTKLKIALLADSHIGTTFGGEGFGEHLRKIQQQSPDILLISGDLVDDWSPRGETFKACEELGRMKLKYGVWFAYGNHDKGHFANREFTAEELERELKANGVHVLSDEYELVDDSFYVVGRKDAMYPRKSIDELLAGVDESKYIIVLDHEPNDYKNEAASAADLVVSGHTHGGQMIPITYVGEWLGINDRTYGHENRSGTDFIVTSGISDWEIKFKTGTRSEYVIINLESEMGLSH